MPYSSLDVVVGGQTGSESKGRVAAALVSRRTAAIHPSRRVISVRVGGPNAGHVVIDPTTGDPLAMRQIPVGLIEPTSVLYIAPGSEVDLDVLAAEIDLLENTYHYEIRPRLFVSPEATILTPDNIATEKASDLVARLGSTAKGIGAARADRIWRTAPRVADRREWFDQRSIRVQDPVRPSLNCPVVIEGTQGYGLGLHAGAYPQCTSGDCRAIDFCAQAGVNPWDVAADHFQVHVVVRPYPIRVAGNSGPLHEETTWEELGLAPERTTVTQKIRRVGHFDADLVAEAVQANGRSVSKVHLAMADQVAPSLAGADEIRAYLDLADTDPRGVEALNDLISAIETHSDAPVVSLGTGPRTEIDLEEF